MASPAVERVGWTLIHFVWEGALVAAVLAAALWLIPSRYARLRYGLACIALALVAAMPVATFLALAPEAPPTLSGHEIGQGWSFSPGETIVGHRSLVELCLPYFVGAWGIGVALLCARLVGSLAHLERWKRRHANPAPSEWQERLERLAAKMGVRRRISLLVSERALVPSAWGVLRAVVVLPTSLLTSLSPVEVETILMHEIAHIRRHDYIVNLLQAIVETLLFYHPAVWWVSRIVRQEREHCCDDVVVRQIADPMPYARALLHLEERRHPLPHPTLSALGGNLMNRVARIMGATPAPAPARLSPVLSGLAAVAVVGAVLGGTLQARAQSVPKKVSVSQPGPTAPAAAVKKAAPTPIVLSTSAKSTKAKSPAHLAQAVNASAAAEAKKVELRKKLLEEYTRSFREVATRGELAASKAKIAQLEVSLATLRAQQRTSSPRPTEPAIRATEDEITSSVQANQGGISVDIKGGPFVAILRRLAQVTGLQIVIEPGSYKDLNVFVYNLNQENALRLLCRVGGATYRKEGDIYYILPKPAPEESEKRAIG